MLSVLLTMVVTYLLTSLLGYIVHWAIHQRWAGFINRAHMTHHLRTYPPGDLVSDRYRSAGSQSAVYTFLIAFSPLILAPIVLRLAGAFTTGQALAAGVAMATVGLLNDIIHDSFHVWDHWLGWVVPGYATMRRRHFIHHNDMKVNFGIYDFVWDRILGSFKR